jgi:hypothetical protein
MEAESADLGRGSGGGCGFAACDDGGPAWLLAVAAARSGPNGADLDPVMLGRSLARVSDDACCGNYSH